VEDSPPKGGLILHVIFDLMIEILKLEMALKEGLAAYQLVGEVTAHQG
jgi:hypothetical protein